MSVSRSVLLEQSVQIAWDFLDHSGKIQDGASAGRFLLESIERMMRRGTTNRMFLANKAINQYLAHSEMHTVIRFPEHAPS